jgi:hypothetical protein
LEVDDSIMDTSQMFSDALRNILDTHTDYGSDDFLIKISSGHNRI